MGFMLRKCDVMIYVILKYAKKLNGCWLCFLQKREECVEKNKNFGPLTRK